MSALLAVGSLVLGLWLGWWARGHGWVQTVPVPTVPRAERAMAPTEAAVLRNPYEDPQIAKKMVDEFVASAQRNGVAYDLAEIEADVADMLREVR